MLQFNVFINHKIICDKCDQYFKNLIEYKIHFKKFCSICNNRLTNKEFCHLSDIKLSNNKAIIFKHQLLIKYENNTNYFTKSFSYLNTTNYYDLNTTIYYTEEFKVII
jgi:hypothetical protein